MRNTCITLGLSVLLLLTGGCASDGKKSLTQDTNDKVSQVVTQLDTLNKTTLDLQTKQDSNDENIRKVQSQMEEMQARMDGMKKDIKTVQKVVYQQNNLTMPGSTGTQVNVEPPAGAPANDTAAPAPAASAPTPAAAAAAAPAEMDQMSTSKPARTTVAESTPSSPAPVAAPAASGNPKELYQQAQQRYMSDDFAGAVKLFDDFLAKYPDDEAAANAQFWKAKSQLRVGQYEDAIKEFLKIPEKYPSSTKVPFSYHNAAVAYNKLGRNEDAAKLLQKVIDKYPISPAADQARQDLKQIKGQ